MRKSHKKTGYVFSAISAFGIIPFIVACFFIIGLLFNFTDTIREIAYQDVKLISKIFTAIIVIILELLSFKISSLTDECEEMEAEIIKIKTYCDKIIARNVLKCKGDLNEKEFECDRKLKEKESECDRKLKEKDKIVRKLDSLLKTKTPFKECAQLFADMHTSLYKQSEYYLMHKDRPARTAAENIRQMRLKSKHYISQYREMLYKYEFLIQSFPDIKNFINNEEELVEISKYLSYSDLEDNRDRSRDYLSEEEWRNLSIDARNQLALDRYVQGRKKSSWAIGRDYEMSCAHFLRNKNFEVTLHGIENGVHDLGRDLICYSFPKNLFGEYDLNNGLILVVQCKYWRKELEIRENVIIQLYGSTISFKIEHDGILSHNVKIIPILMIPDFSTISDTALRFAKMLNIRIIRQNMVDYPRIKCNINQGNKIYHLPFDQQYDRTQIKNEGEFYAYTVEEATKKGFRRAMRHFQ